MTAQQPERQTESHFINWKGKLLVFLRSLVSNHQSYRNYCYSQYSQLGFEGSLRLSACLPTYLPTYPPNFDGKMVVLQMKSKFSNSKHPRIQECQWDHRTNHAHFLNQEDRLKHGNACNSLSTQGPIRELFMVHFCNSCQHTTPRQANK